MIKVVFFASLREAVGRAEMEVAAQNRQGLMDALRSELSAEALSAITAEYVHMAVNQELVDGEVVLNAGDEVAFLPPVTGG